jgi:hypothetical protein
MYGSLKVEFVPLLRLLPVTVVLSVLAQSVQNAQVHILSRLGMESCRLFDEFLAEDVSIPAIDSTPLISAGLQLSHWETTWIIQ